MVQASAQQQRYDQNRVNALAAARGEQTQLTQRQIQEQQAVEQKKYVSLIEEAQKKATASVAGAEAGVAGISLSNIIADLGQRSEYNRAVAKENYDNIAAQLSVEQNATVTRAEGRINSVPQGDFVSPFFSAASTGLQLYAQSD
jgi:hypothetical protein